MSAKYLELRIGANQAAVLSRDFGDIGASLSTAAQLIRDGAITVRLSVGKKGNRAAKHARGQNLLEIANRLLGLGLDLNHFQGVRLVGQVGNRNDFPVDLLEEKFAHKIFIGPAPHNPGDREIRDESHHIQDQYRVDQNFLNEVANRADGEPDIGLLGNFREQGGGDAAADEPEQ
jgi:hypothetical protein